MKKCYTSFVLLLIATSVCFTPVAQASGADEVAGKCLVGTHIVKIIQGDFSSSASPQRVIVSRALDVTKGGAVCSYHIGWQFFQPTLRTWLSEGDGWTYPGPGLVFLDGLWQPQSPDTVRHLDVEPVRVLGNRLQLAIYRERDAPEGMYSDLAIYAITGGYGVPETLLHVADVGRLTYTVEKEVIEIKGDYESPALHPNVLSGYEVRLKYDSGAGQMAIVDQSKAADLFYKSLLDMGAGFYCGHGYRIAPCVR